MPRWGKRMRCPRHGAYWDRKGCQACLVEEERAQRRDQAGRESPDTAKGDRRA